MNRNLILFAKAPVPGRVKTRLIPALGPDLAAALHRAFVLDTLESLRGFPLELHTDQAGWIEYPRVKLQVAGDLGVRMHHALQEALTAGAGAACIVGSDAPSLPPRHVAALFDSPGDVALGPSEDGGYWGICARRTDPRMFDGVEWSTRHTRVQTLRAFDACGLTHGSGADWWDVDELPDLRRLFAGPFVPRHTMLWLDSCPVDVRRGVLP